MKKLNSIMLIFFFSLLSVSCTMLQPVPTPEAKVYNIQGVKKAVIYEKSQQWIAENFGKAKEVIQYKNLDEGRIIAKGISNIQPRGDMYSRGFYFTWVIDIKDERIRVEYKNISAYTDGQVVGVPYASGTKNDIDVKMTSYINDMINYIQGSDSKNW